MIRKSAKRLVKSYLDWSFHLDHKKKAHKILKSIESVKGKTDPKLIKISDEYATDILGWEGYAPWLYVYSAMNNKFKEGWIPDNYYGKIVVPKLKGYYGTISEYNSLTSRLFNSSYLPDCAYYTNGLWISPEYQILSDKEIIEIAFNNNARVVYKIDNSLQGVGVHILEKDNFNIDKLKMLGNGVLQKYIRQHSFFQEIMPSSVVTLRVTSVVDDKGIVTVRACYLRIARSFDTLVRSYSHIRVSVDSSTGVLDKYGYTTKWHQIENHPDTGFKFENKKIPDFEKIVDTMINLHKMVPFVRTIGWDVILNENNDVQVMEWNGTENDIKFSEATNGPCFSGLGWEDLWKKGN